MGGYSWTTASVLRNLNPGSGCGRAVSVGSPDQSGRAPNTLPHGMCQSGRGGGLFPSPSATQGFLEEDRRAEVEGAKDGHLVDLAPLLMPRIQGTAGPMHHACWTPSVIRPDLPEHRCFRSPAVSPRSSSAPLLCHLSPHSLQTTVPKCISEPGRSALLDETWPPLPLSPASLFPSGAPFHLGTCAPDTLAQLC